MQTRTRPISSHFVRKNLVHNEFIIWQKIKLFSCGTKEGNPERVANRNRGFVLLCRSPIQPKNEAKILQKDSGRCGLMTSPRGLFTEN